MLFVLATPITTSSPGLSEIGIDGKLFCLCDDGCGDEGKTGDGGRAVVVPAVAAMDEDEDGPGHRK